ncbi:Lysine-specific permease [Smittium culicis]|uniref:Lysine-specific permease n=2 Tax=Smittium culicis TaxID=133412 RepID=A0A1R1XN33_9FUNG|nr:Lysine-specific permease [Smittium culicis]
MLAIGGTVGNGIFIATGSVLSDAGPLGTLISYTLTGAIVFFVIESLAEMSTYIPVTGSFNSFADRFVDPAFGFSMAYNYWYSWIITIAIDLISVGLVVQYWANDINPIIWSAIALLIIVAINFFGPKILGESGFWLSFIKIASIIIFIIIGFLVATGILGGVQYGLSNFKYKDAPFVNGVPGTLSAFITAGFAFQGVEIIGIASGESKNPSKDIPRAAHSVFWRINSYYFFVLLIICLVVPYDTATLIDGKTFSVAESPLVIVMEKAGIKFSNHVFNGIILTSILAAANSSMYLTTRTLFSLSVEKKFFKPFKKVTENGNPIYCLLVGAVIVTFTISISYFGDERVYEWLVAFSGTAGLISWIGILFSHHRFRKAYIYQGFYLDDLPFKSKLFPFGNYFSFFCLTFIVLSQGYTTGIFRNFTAVGFIKAYFGVMLFLILYLSYKLYFKTKIVGLSEMDLLTDSYNQLGFVSERFEKTSFKEKLLSFIF